MARHQQDLDENPAAFAALEGAIIDCLARQAGQSLEQFLGLPQLKESCRYSAVLGDSRPTLFWLQALAYGLVGFRDFKVKLSGDLERDRAKLAVFKRLPFLRRARVRADANNLWTNAQSCIDYIRQLETSFWAVEEPVTACAWSDHSAIARALDTKIILDESLLRIAQLQESDELPAFAIANIRISKNGGLLRSLALARAAADKGIPLIFGAHVGESSVLTRAALCIANACDAYTLAREGAFGRLLLKHEPVRPSLRFGWGGRFRTARFLPTSHLGSGLQPVKVEQQDTA